MFLVSHVISIHYTQSKIFYAVTYYNFEDYGLQIMKPQNFVFQKNRILNSINKKMMF